MGLNICPNSKESLEGFDCKSRKDLSQMGNDVLVTVGSISQDEQRKSASSKRQEDWKGNLGQKSTEVNSTPEEANLARLVQPSKDSFHWNYCLKRVSKESQNMAEPSRSSRAIRDSFEKKKTYMSYHKEARIPRKPSYHNDHLYDENRKDKEYTKWYKREKTFGYNHNFPPSYDDIFSPLSTKFKKKKSSSKQFSKQRELLSIEGGKFKKEIQGRRRASWRNLKAFLKERLALLVEGVQNSCLVSLDPWRTLRGCIQALLPHSSYSIGLAFISASSTGGEFTRELKGVLEPSWNPKGIRGRRSSSGLSLVSLIESTCNVNV
ncbi:hypothetical protein Fmac_005763 [Flemingia macrophylla]|uniref:Ycf1 n=1 Tax=Flemingia macrophylla TaxID=520843 RepID=A0ABD1NA27_9FABA